MAPKLELTPTEDRIVQILKQHPEGIADEELSSLLQDVSPEARMQAVNRLTAEHRLSIFQSSEGLAYKGVEAEQAARFKGLSRDDNLVYQEIKKSHNKGIWTKDLKYRTNLQQLQITKILKTLEQRSLVKAVKSASNASRKVYMLFELEPAKELTGGAWYSQQTQTFDSQFFQVLQRLVKEYIQDEGEVSLDQVSNHIKDKNVSNEALEESDVFSIIRTLYFEGKIDIMNGEDGDVYRPAMLPIPETSALTSVPCGVCPVIQDCTPDGPISPATCTYFQNWLDF